MITEGIEVLMMIVNLDPDSGAACIDKATAAGIADIDYDRLTLGGGADYYVSFDNVSVGALQGEGLISALDAAGKTKANIVYVNGAATDNNATLFKSGYEAALKPKIDAGDYTLVGDQSGEWDATKAGNVFEQMYTQNKGKIDGAITANDTMAGGVIARQKTAGVEGEIPVTGQDATVEGLAERPAWATRPAPSTRTPTSRPKAAAEPGDRDDQRQQDDADAIVTGTVNDSGAGEDVPSVLATPVWITADTVQTVVDAGFASAADV